MSSIEQISLILFFSQACSDVLYSLMLACWKDKYLERPKFVDLVQQLTQFIQSPNRLIPLAKQK